MLFFVDIFASVAAADFLRNIKTGCPGTLSTLEKMKINLEMKFICIIFEIGNKKGKNMKKFIIVICGFIFCACSPSFYYNIENPKKFYNNQWTKSFQNDVSQIEGWKRGESKKDFEKRYTFEHRKLVHKHFHKQGCLICEFCEQERRVGTNAIAANAASVLPKPQPLALENKIESNGLSKNYSTYYKGCTGYGRKTVYVKSYTRMQNGKVVHVRSHYRSSPRRR